VEGPWPREPARAFPRNRRAEALIVIRILATRLPATSVEHGLVHMFASRGATSDVTLQKYSGVRSTPGLDPNFFLKKILEYLDTYINTKLGM